MFHRPQTTTYTDGRVMSPQGSKEYQT